MTRMGTNATGCAAARNAINVSDSTSKCSVWSGRAAQVARWMSRKPHCESGRGRPARRESSAAHPAIHLPAQPGNGARVGHPVADHQQRPGLFGAFKKSRHVIRLMLAVAVQCEGPLKALLLCLGQAGPERGAFAEIFCVRDHLSTSRLSLGCRVVRRTIVHDEHPGKLPARRGNYGRNARALVETGNHHRAGRRFRHAFSLNKSERSIEAKPAGRVGQASRLSPFS